jgi:membrane protease YdiL (CAAX protease family)
MSTPTPYLDCLILASATYPSGFSHTLFTLRRGSPAEVSSPFLAVLVLPYLAIAVAVAWLRPDLLSFHGAPLPLFALAAVLAPLALGLEYGIHGLLAWRAGGRFPRAVTVQRFWGRGLSPLDHLLLLAIVVGEEILYRQVWLGALAGTLGLPVWLALAVSSLAYGLNHLAFGTASVFSKSVSGLVYGGVYLFGGQCVWLPVVTHGLQNLALFGVAKGARG